MNNIKWKVEQINVDSGFGETELSVEINGMFTNAGAFRKPITFDGFAKEIEHKLNDDPMGIKNVIFNDPTTIVFWADGTKTVVKCQEGDEFDPEKGLTMAIVKKVYGNKGSYCNEIKKWVEPYYEKQKEKNDLVSKICDLGKKASAALAALTVAETAIVNAKEQEEKKHRDFYKYDDPVFDTRGEAEQCLDALKDVIEKYGCTTIADLYDIAGLETDMCYTMNKYGWTNLNHSKIHRTRHGYVIDLPKAMWIDSGESDDLCQA